MSLNTGNNHIEDGRFSEMAGEIVKAVEGLETDDTALNDINFSGRVTEMGSGQLDENQARIELFRESLLDEFLNALKADGVVDPTQQALFREDIAQQWLKRRSVRPALQELYMAARGGDYLDTARIFGDFYSDLKDQFDERMNPPRTYEGETVAADEVKKAVSAPRASTREAVEDTYAGQSGGKGLELDADTKRRLGYASTAPGTGRWMEEAHRHEVYGGKRRKKPRTGTEG